MVAGYTVAEDAMLGEWIDEGHAFAASPPPIGHPVTPSSGH
ncbi:hypothetical protein [Streptomyces diastatochromogenes]